MTELSDAAKLMLGKMQKNTAKSSSRVDAAHLQTKESKPEEPVVAKSHEEIMDAYKQKLRWGLPEGISLDRPFLTAEEKRGIVYDREAKWKKDLLDIAEQRLQYIMDNIQLVGHFDIFSTKVVRASDEVRLYIRHRITMIKRDKQSPYVFVHGGERFLGAVASVKYTSLTSVSIRDVLETLRRQLMPLYLHEFTEGIVFRGKPIGDHHTVVGHTNPIKGERYYLEKYKQANSLERISSMPDETLKELARHSRFAYLELLRLSGEAAIFRDKAKYMEDCYLCDPGLGDY